jgi:ubiquinone/menaquinone biosynthesis C-methylase UbiE
MTETRSTAARPDPARYFRHYPLTHPAAAVVRRSASAIRRHARRYLGGRMLDVGCGAGWKRDLVGDLVDRYVGLDHEDSMHGLAAVDILGSAYEIPEPDASFDSVLCTTVLEHLERPAAALGEAFRVLRPGGYALYTAPLFWHLHEKPRDFFRYTEYGLRQLLTDAGYEIVCIEAQSGFWLTAAAELNYYLLSALPRPLRPLRPLVRLAIAWNNLTAPLLDTIDTRLHPGSRDWTWLYLVVARRPAADG